MVAASAVGVLGAFAPDVEMAVSSVVFERPQVTGYCFPRRSGFGIDMSGDISAHLFPNIGYWVLSTLGVGSGHLRKRPRVSREKVGAYTHSTQQAARRQ